MIRSNHSISYKSDEEENDPTSGFSLEQIRKWMKDKLHLGKREECDSDQRNPVIFSELSLDGMVEYIKEGKAKNIITMAGAGISTSAGIPDFRSPSSGIYANLGKFNLPNPMAIFDIRYFRRIQNLFLCWQKNFTQKVLIQPLAIILSSYFMTKEFSLDIILRILIC